jgi:cytochrome c oxidase cbb3-type subunit III
VWKNIYGMNFLRSVWYGSVLLAVPLLLSLTVLPAQTPSGNPQAPGEVSPEQTPTVNPQAPRGVGQTETVEAQPYPPALVESGGLLFRQDCSFCHGRDAGGGESGPDLTRSKVVTEDKDGDKIGPVVRNGRLEKGMPRFEVSDQELAGLVAFIHTEQKEAAKKKGRRSGVDVSDLQTGNAEAGRQFFNGAGGCSNCHSPTGDLARIASRYEGLKLEEQMLYPKQAKSKVTVTLSSGQTITGTLEYLDEFTVGLIDSAGVYRSWKSNAVEYKVDAPVDAHVELFSKYTDDDIHNLMAYLQTLH